MEIVAQYLHGIKKNSPFFIESGGVEKNVIKSIYTKENETENLNKFLSRNICTGNYSHMFILPDGNVTICEELYWNPHFIIGNVNEHGIEQIWKSEKALALYNIKQDEHPKESSCNSCMIYNKCRIPKQICYRDIIRKYGEEKWYTRCFLPYSEQINVKRI